MPISLEACAAHDPANVALLTDLAAGYEASGRIDLAEGAYRRALTIDAKDGDLHVRLGELLLKRGDRSGAHAEAESALRWHPASARALGLAARSATAGRCGEPSMIGSRQEPVCVAVNGLLGRRGALPRSAQHSMGILPATPAF